MLQKEPEGSLPYSQATRSNYNTNTRTDPYSNEIYNSGKSYQTIAEREKLPSSTHFTLGPPSVPVNQDVLQLPPQLREHMANVQSDNQSLMRRLNLVMQELERVSKEKDDIYTRLRHSSKEIGDLQGLINSEDNVDKVNKYMSDDLVYERDRNHKLKSKIKELDLYRNELIHELRKIQEKQDDLAKENQHLSITLQQKLNMIQDIEKEHFFTQEKIQQANNGIETLKLELMDENTDKMELQKILSQLIIERNDLLSRLEHLTRKYDECVRDISHDRAEMERHNKQHAKLITAKIIFQQLEQMQRTRKAASYSEFKQYCNFDQRCHLKLNNFAQVLLSIGHFKMRKALRQWFKKALQPIKMRQQSFLLASFGNDQQLKRKMFISWKKEFDAKIDKYDQKTRAIQHIWQMWSNDSSIEIKRSFTIWKECLVKYKLQQSSVKKLIWRLYFNKLNYAFNEWTKFSSDIDNQVRMNLLAKQFSQKQYLTILFHNFKLQIKEQKRKRFNILFHSLKAWKDYLSHQKFLMGSNVVALHFRRNCDISLMKHCFDAMRKHKQQEQLNQLHSILHEEELPLINQLQNETDDIEIQRKFKAKNKAVESVKKMMSKQLYGYFQHWKGVNEYYKEQLRTTIKGKIIKYYMDQIRKAFTYWKAIHDGSKISQHEMVIQEFQEQGAALQNDVIDLKKDIQNRQEQRDCSQQKKTLKCVASYQKRMKQIALGRWRDQISDMNFKEDGADTIIKRMRLRFLRQAFDLYVAGVKYRKKLEIEEERCKLYHRTRNERLKKVIMNNWLIFSENHKRAKKYWYRMYLRLDIGMKQIALKRWREWTHKHLEQELTNKQNNIVSTIDTLNHQIGELHQNETEQQLDIKGMKHQMTTQARRIISNAFAKFYYVSSTRGFEKWKEYVDYEKKKERIIKKTLDHWKKYQFYYVKSSFQNWMINCDIQERKEQLKKEEMRVNDSSFQLDMQNKLFNAMRSKLHNEIDEIQKLQKMYNARLQKSVGLIINKVENNNYMLQKRYILTQWRDYVKREVNFIKCIQNVIQKSMWSKAFTEIRQFSRRLREDTTKEDVLNRFRLKFWKRTCGNAFSVWRSGAFTLVSQVIEEVDSDTQNVIEDHQNKKTLLKEVNEVRSERHLNKQGLRNLFQSWRNVTLYLKQQHRNDSDFKVQQEILNKRLALWKWQQRKNATKLARLRQKKLREKFYRIRLRLYFYALRDQFSITKQFCIRIANLASIHNHQGLKLSLNAINSYVKAKKFVHETKKSHASRDIESILNSLVLRRKQLYWREFRVKRLDARKESMIKFYNVLHTLSNKVRYFFQKWKESSNERTLALEMHNEGPVREQVFELKAQFKNLKGLMNEQGYDEKDVQDAIKQEKARQAQLLLKGIRRAQNFTEELYPKPKAFDRWKQFVHMRKLFRYWLGFANKRGEYVRSDLHYAFDKWRYYYDNQYGALSKLSKEQLEKRLIKNNKHLDHIAEDVDEKENYLENLSNQREALVENYVKGQKLALSLWVNNRKRTLHQAFLRWCKRIKTDNNINILENLRRNLGLIENLKQRIAQFESENESLANENEELRQFSLDGYEIAKNVQTLTAERENLSVDLADKAQIIRKLLDENEKLTSKLRSAQDEAQKLIRSSMAGSSGFKSGVKTGFTGMTKSTNY